MAAISSANPAVLNRPGLPFLRWIRSKESSLTYYLDKLPEWLSGVVRATRKSDVLAHVDGRAHVELLREPAVRHAHGLPQMRGNRHFPGGRFLLRRRLSQFPPEATEENS